VQIKCTKCFDVCSKTNITSLKRECLRMEAVEDRDIRRNKKVPENGTGYCPSKAKAMIRVL